MSRRYFHVAAASKLLFAGQGHALRQQISSPIREHLGRHQLRLTMTAANDQVAAIYQREIPGLVDVGRGYPACARERA